MRYPAAEQLEIIRLVEQSPLPARPMQLNLTMPVQPFRSPRLRRRSAHRSSRPLSLRAGSGSCCPTPDLAQMERARNGGGAHGAQHHGR